MLKSCIKYIKFTKINKDLRKGNHSAPHTKYVLRIRKGVAYGEKSHKSAQNLSKI